MKDPAPRYKMLLRIYPRDYRSVRGDEILGTLLDVSGERGLTPGEVMYVLVHTVKVWVRRIILGAGADILCLNLFRFVTWVLIALCTWNWLGALFDFIGHHPQNDIPPGPVAAGFVFFGLNVLIQARRRFLYVLAIAVITSFVVSGLIQTAMVVWVDRQDSLHHLGLVVADRLSRALMVLIAGDGRRLLRTLKAG